MSEQGTAIFRLQDHTKRLFNSAKMMDIEIPYTDQQLNEAQKEVLKKNNLDSAYIRPMIFYGAEGMGLHTKALKVHGIVAAWEWGAYLGEENMRRGISVKVSSIARYSVKTAMCRAKANGYYINSMLALQEAQRHGYDEALMLDVDGYLAEGSGENIFVLSKGVLYTPDLGCVLDGITPPHDYRTCPQRTGFGGDRKKNYPRPSLHCRRSVFHRHRSGSRANPQD